MILKSLNKKSKVTSLRSVKSVHTKSVLGMDWTRLDYTLDGRAESAVFLGHSNNIPFSPEETIKEAVYWSKKRKANLKPGPVSAN